MAGLPENVERLNPWKPGPDPEIGPEDDGGWTQALANAASVEEVKALALQRAQVQKSLSPTFGRRLVRRAQLIRRLKQRRTYSPPVAGGRGKQHRTRRNRWL